MKRFQLLSALAVRDESGKHGIRCNTSDGSVTVYSWSTCDTPLRRNEILAVVSPDSKQSGCV